MVVPFRVMPPALDTADPETILISSDEKGDGAAHREDLAQFVSTWVRRWPSQSASSLVAEFVDIGADDRERLRDLAVVGVESE